MSASDAVSGLTEAHRNQILAYTRFFTAKRKVHLQDVRSHFEQASETAVDDADVYSAGDVRGLLDNTKIIVASGVEEELAAFARQSVLYLRQLYLQAEGQGVSLEISTAELDDEVLLRGLQQLEERPAAAAPAPLGRLASLGGGPGVDIDQVARANQLREENARLERRFAQLQAQYRASAQENAKLKEEMDRMGHAAAGAQRDLASTGATLDQTVAALRSELAAAQKRTEEAQDALQGRLNDSPPFVELKRMMQKKNAQIKELRKRVAELEGGAAE